MLRYVLLALLVGCVVWQSGCGGSSSSSSQNTVTIQQTRFAPKNITTSVNNRVAWVNADTIPHQVVSGTLAPTTNPQTRTPNIAIQQNNTFVPDIFQMNLGDTVQFQNNQTGSFLLDILDDAQNVVASLTFQNSGRVIAFSAFPAAGRFTIQQHNNPNFNGAIFVFGTPTPDNRFTSQVLGNGGSFSTQFTQTGTFPYYDLNLDNPNQSFMTGTITVQ